TLSSTRSAVDIYNLSLHDALPISRSKSLSLDANSYHLKIFIDPIYDGGNMGFVVIIIDNSETRKAELMRREFSANVTHELKSPRLEEHTSELQSRFDLVCRLLLEK